MLWAGDRHAQKKQSGHTQTHTYPHTPAGSGGEQPKPGPKHTEPHHTPQQGVAGYKRSALTGTHRHPKHPSQEWRGSAATRAQPHTPTPHTLARSAGVQTERAHKQAHPPKTPARSRRAHPPPEPKHTHPRRTPQPGVSGYRWNAHTTTHTRKPQPGMARCKPKPRPKRTHHKPQLGMEGRSQNPYPSTPTQNPSQDWRGYRETQTKTQAPHNSRKPSVHSPGTEAARAMQVTRPNEIRRLGVRLHPKACAA